MSNVVYGINSKITQKDLELQNINNRSVLKTQVSEEINTLNSDKLKKIKAKKIANDLTKDKKISLKYIVKNIPKNLCKILPYVRKSQNNKERE